MRDYLVYCEHARRIDEAAPGLPPTTTLCGAVAAEYWIEGSPYKVALCSKHLQNYEPEPTPVED